MARRSPPPTNWAIAAESPLGGRPEHPRGWNLDGRPGGVPGPLHSAQAVLPPPAAYVFHGAPDDLPLPCPVPARPRPRCRLERPGPDLVRRRPGARGLADRVPRDLVCRVTDESLPAGLLQQWLYRDLCESRRRGAAGLPQGHALGGAGWVFTSKPVGGGAIDPSTDYTASATYTARTTCPPA